MKIIINPNSIEKKQTKRIRVQFFKPKFKIPDGKTAQQQCIQSFHFLQDHPEKLPFIQQTLKLYQQFLEKK